MTEKIFFNDDDKDLCDYFKVSSQLCYVLITTLGKTLSNNYAQLMEKEPSSWQEIKTDGEKWLFV